MTMKKWYETIIERIDRQRLFDWAFCLYFCAYFIEDMAFDSGSVVKVIRYAAYLGFGAYFLTGRPSKNRLLTAAALFAVNFVIGLPMRDFYWAILVVVLCSFSDVRAGRTLNNSFKLLLILTGITLLLAIIGVLPNHITSRQAGATARYGLGFYHSNVFPAVVFYLMVFRLLLLTTKGGMKLQEMAIWAAAAVVVYVICGSRNALLGTFLCLALCALITCVKLDSRVQKTIRFAAKWAVLFCVTFSVIAMMVQGIDNTLVHWLNGLFSGRFSIAYFQMQETGLSLINTMPRDMFNVLDNGYLYIVLRYGLLYVLFYVYVQYRLVVKYRSNMTAVVVFMTVAVMNMIDNDLCSYGFLPFLVLAFNNTRLKQVRAEQGRYKRS